jgi:hypothetical protein
MVAFTSVLSLSVMVGGREVRSQISLNLIEEPPKKQLLNLINIFLGVIVIK